jgi:hypothetical protein
MFGAAFYTFGPTAFEQLGQLPANDRGFQILFAITGVTLGICIQILDTAPNLLVGVTVPGLFLSGGILLAYLIIIHGWTIANPEGKAVSLLQTTTPHEDVREELAQDFSYDGILGVAAKTFFIFGITTFLGIPIVLAAMSGRMLANTFPLPDIVFLCWAVSARLLPRAAVGPDKNRIADLDFDIEAYLLDKIELATRSIQGMVCTLFIVLALFSSSQYLFISVTIAPPFVTLLQTALRSMPGSFSLQQGVIIWNVTGVIVLLLLAGSYSFWVWVREFARLPHFLDEWEGRDFGRGRLPTRVSGFVIIPLIGWLVDVLFMTFESVAAFGWFTITWPLVVLTGLVSTWHTLYRNPQPVSNENVLIVAGLGLQTASIWIGANPARVTESVLTSAPLLPALIAPVGICVLVTVVALIPIVSRYEKNHQDICRYILPGLLLCIGGLTGVAVPAVPPQYRVVVIVLSVVTSGSAALLGIIRYYRL